MRRIDPAVVVVLAGVSAALHVGKLPPALPVLRDALSLTLVQAGFLLSLVQLAGMTLGLLAGLTADGIGLRRSMLGGLLLLGVASAAGGWAQDASSLMALRAVEGAGFLLAAMPAPSLIRRLVPPAQMDATLGLWGAYMPLGTALALLVGPVVMAVAGWQAWWLGLACVSFGMALWVWRAVPADAPVVTRGDAPAALRLPDRLRLTLGAPGPWLVALSFAMYSGQWLAVIGFLPSIYAQASVPGGLAAVLTALAAAANIVGNIASGRLLQRGAAPQKLLYLGFAVMGLGAWMAFSMGVPWGTTTRYLAVLLFSMVGGMIPATLFSLSVRLAPDAGTVSTTVGWMHQCSALGQFLGPPAVAWVAGVAGGWHWTWVVTGICCLFGIGLARGMAEALARDRLESGAAPTPRQDTT